MKQTSAGERAVNYFSDALLCSQALLMTFAPRFDLDLSTAARIAAPFGAGIGRLGNTCGAVSGALMVIGLQFGHEFGDDTETKERVFELTREFLRRFESRHGSVECRTLLGRDLSNPKEHELAGVEGLFETRCPGFVRDAAEIVAEILESG